MKFLRDSEYSVENSKCRRYLTREARSTGRTYRSYCCRPLPWPCFSWTLALDFLPCLSLILSRLFTCFIVLVTLLYTYVKLDLSLQKQILSAPETKGYNLHLIEGNGHFQTEHTEPEIRKAKEQSSLKVSCQLIH